LLQTTTPRAALAALATLTLAGPASAVVFEDFPFNDPNGTELGAAENVANPGNQWNNSSGGVAIPGDVANSFVQDGVFRVQKDDDFFSTRHLQIDNITSGVRYLVVENATWNIVDDNLEEPEDIGWAFLDNDSGFSGSTITAQMQLGLFAPGTLLFEGTALGGGSSDAPSPVFFGTQQSEPVDFVLKLDRDSQTYEALFRVGDQEPVSLGVADTGIADAGADPDGLPRDGNSIRWRFNNNFGAEGEFFEVDRVYLTDQDPFTDAPDLVGDLNGDGFVGAGDLDILLGVWNQNDSGVADLNDDGFIGAGDLDILLGNWNAGTAPGGSAGVVPEPASLAVLAGLGAAGLFRRRNA